MELFPSKTKKAKNTACPVSGPGEVTLAVALVKKNGRLWVMRRIEIVDGIVVSFKDTVDDSKDVCMWQAEEALLDATV